MTTEPTQVLCTTCFDEVGATRILAIEPRQTCERCGRVCLGYRTVVTKDTHA